MALFNKYTAIIACAAVVMYYRNPVMELMERRIIAREIATVNITVEKERTKQVEVKEYTKQLELEARIEFDRLLRRIFDRGSLDNLINPQLQSETFPCQDKQDPNCTYSL